MSTKISTLLFRVDGDATNANKAMSSVGKSAGGLGSKIAKVGAAIAAAFSVQKIIQFGKESVRAMMEDQKSAAILARTLKNVTKAKADDIAITEAFINKTAMATGIADDELRPAFARLVRTTKDTTKAQKLLNLALDMSAATGKPLSSVVNALGRAADGSLSGLTRMGVSIDKATLKSKDFAKVLPQLQEMFGGSMQADVGTFAGQVRVLSNAWGEIKEAVGYELQKPLAALTTWMTGKGLKAIQAFFSALFGNSSERDPSARADDFRSAVDPLQGSAANAGKAFHDLVVAIGDLFKAFGDGTSAESGFVKFINGMSKLVDLLSQAVTLIGQLNPSDPNGKPHQWSLNLDRWGESLGNWSSKYGPRRLLPDWMDKDPFARWNGKGRAIGGTVSGGRPMLVGERGPEIFTPSASGYITANNRLGMGGGGVNVTVNVQGSVIRERDLAVSVRDEIAQLMRRRGLNPAILGV